MSRTREPEPLWRLLDIPTRGNRRQERLHEFAEWAGVDTDTVLRWEKGEEPIPEEMIMDISDLYGLSILSLMGWHHAPPRGAASDELRRVIAEDSVARVEYHLPDDCEGVLGSVEWALGAIGDLDEERPEFVTRLRRLRAALLDFVSEPIEMEAC